jgi:recombination protein RecA
MMANEKTKMDVLRNLRKNFGNDAVFSGSTVLSVSADPIPTSSYALDSAIGIGGIPRGRITQFGGATRSGKTFMSLQCVKEWQKMDPKNFAVWFDAEYSFEPSWATKLGIDMDRLDVVRENDGAKIFNGLCGIPAPKTGKIVGGVLNELIEAHGKDSGLGLIVLDSIASLVPPVEANYDLAHQNMAALARFLPQALRRICPLLERGNIAMIFINQIRVDPGVQYGNPESSPGGNGLKHAEHLMVNFNKSNAGDKKIENKNGDPIGHTIMARIDKNRVGLPGRKLDIRIKYLEGVIDHNIEMLALGIGYGLIARPNNRTYIYKTSKWTSKDEALAGLANPEIIKEIWNEVKNLQAQGRTFNDNVSELDEEEGE